MKCTWCNNTIDARDKKLVMRHPAEPHLPYHKHCYTLYLNTVKRLFP